MWPDLATTVLACVLAGAAGLSARLVAQPEVKRWLGEDAPVLHSPLLHAVLAAAVALLPLSLLLRAPSPAEGIALGLWAGLLTSCALIDLRCRLLPDRLTVALAAIGVVISLSGLGPGLMAALAGGAFGYLLPWAVGSLMRKRSSADAQSEPIGRGDLALLGAMGLWVGFSGLPLVIVGASLVMLPLITWGMLRFGWNRSTALPFGPGLCLAGLVVLPWVLTEGWGA